MTVINQKIASLLDRLYNLKGDNSTILAEMDAERNATEEARSRTTVNKSELEGKLEELGAEEIKLSTQGNNLKQLLSSFGNDDYTDVVNKLGITFNPNEVLSKIDTNLPEELNKIAEEKNTTREELAKNQEELSESITKLEELNIRRAEAVANQERLNRYFELALNSNINITRDDVTMLLEKFGFDEQDQRTAAKLLMFPEDALFEYVKLREENPGVENIADVLKGSKRKEEKDEDIEEEEEEEKPKKTSKSKAPKMPELPEEEPEEIEEAEVEDTPVEEIKIETMDVQENSPIIDFTVPTIEPEKVEIVEEKKEETEAPIEDVVVEETAPVENSVDLILDIPEEPKEEVKDEAKDLTKEDLTNLLNELGLDYLDYTNSEFDELLENMDKDLFKDNIDLVEALGMNKDIFVDNYKLLFDKDLKNKITTLTEVGKLPSDIYLNPSVLTKYDYNELQSAINVLVESGLEPKKVPLIAY